MHIHDMAEIVFCHTYKDILSPEQMEYMHDANYWRTMVSHSRDAEIIEVSEMASNDEVWADWLKPLIMSTATTA